jgi:hypothetical protein
MSRKKSGHGIPITLGQFASVVFDNFIHITANKFTLWFQT